MAIKRHKKIMFNSFIAIIVIALVFALFDYLFYQEGYRAGFSKGNQELVAYKGVYTSAMMDGKKYFFIVNFKMVEKGKKENVVILPFNCSMVNLTDQEEKSLYGIFKKADKRSEQ